MTNETEHYDSPAMHPSVSIGQSLSRAAGLFFRYPLQFLGIGAIATTPVAILEFYCAFAGVSNDNFLLDNLLFQFCKVLCSGVIIQATFQAMRGQQVSVSQSFRKSVPSFGRVAALCVILPLIIWSAMLLLLVPGIIANAVFLVAIPVCVIEGTGAWASLKRSAQLTKGSRWSIAVTCFVFGVAQVIAGGILGAAFGTRYGTTFSMAASLSLLNAVLLAIISIFVAVAYHDLRSAKEGVSLDRIAEVFD